MKPPPSLADGAVGSKAWLQHDDKLLLGGFRACPSRLREVEREPHAVSVWTWPDGCGERGGRGGRGRGDGRIGSLQMKRDGLNK